MEGARLFFVLALVSTGSCHVPKLLGGLMTGIKIGGVVGNDAALAHGNQGVVNSGSYSGSGSFAQSQSASYSASNSGTYNYSGNIPSHGSFIQASGGIGINPFGFGISGSIGGAMAGSQAQGTNTYSSPQTTPSNEKYNHPVSSTSIYSSSNTIKGVKTDSYGNPVGNEYFETHLTEKPQKFITQTKVDNDIYKINAIPTYTDNPKIVMEVHIKPDTVNIGGSSHSGVHYPNNPVQDKPYQTPSVELQVPLTQPGNQYHNQNIPSGGFQSTSTQVSGSNSAASAGGKVSIGFQSGQYGGSTGDYNKQPQKTQTPSIQITSAQGSGPSAGTGVHVGFQSGQYGGSSGTSGFQSGTQDTQKVSIGLETGQYGGVHGKDTQNAGTIGFQAVPTQKTPTAGFQITSTQGNGAYAGASAHDSQKVSIGFQSGQYGGNSGVHMTTQGFYNPAPVTQKTPSFQITPMQGNGGYAVFQTGQYGGSSGLYHKDTQKVGTAVQTTSTQGVYGSVGLQDTQKIGTSGFQGTSTQGGVYSGVGLHDTQKIGTGFQGTSTQGGVYSGVGVHDTQKVGTVGFQATSTHGGVGLQDTQKVGFQATSNQGAYAGTGIQSQYGPKPTLPTKYVTGNTGNKDVSYVSGTKYTGTFGGAPGILVATGPATNYHHNSAGTYIMGGFNTAPTYKPVMTVQTHTQVSGGIKPNNHYGGGFGGAPGILIATGPASNHPGNHGSGGIAHGSAVSGTYGGSHGLGVSGGVSSASASAGSAAGTGVYGNYGGASHGVKTGLVGGLVNGMVAGLSDIKAGMLGGSFGFGSHAASSASASSSSSSGAYYGKKLTIGVH